MMVHDINWIDNPAVETGRKERKLEFSFGYGKWRWLVDILIWKPGVQKRDWGWKRQFESRIFQQLRTCLSNSSLNSD